MGGSGKLSVSAVAIGKPERQVRKASHCGSKQQWRSRAAITLLLLFCATKIWVLIFMHILFVVNHTFNCRLHIQRQPTGCNSTKKEKMIALQNSADV